MSLQTKLIDTRILILSILFIMLSLSHSAYSDASDFDLGLTHFKAEQYEDAIRYFEQTLSSDPEHFSAQYNLAIAHYKLGNLDKAKQFLRELADTEEADSSILYTLGVIEKKQGNKKAAIKYFERVSNAYDSPSLSAAASKQLSILGIKTATRSSKSKKRESSWQSNLSLGLGYDDSILDISEETSTSEGDQYLEMMINTFWQSSYNSPGYWYFNALGFSTQYSEVDDYNIQLAVAGIGRSQKLLGGKVKTQLDYESATLGGNEYLSSLLFTTSYSKKLEHYGTLQLKLRLKNSRSLNEAYDHLAGDSQRFELRFKPDSLGRWDTSIRYIIDSDTRDDRYAFLENDLGELELSSFSNLSAKRHTFKIQTSQQFFQYYNLSMGASFRTTNYDEDFYLNESWLARDDNKYNLDFTLSRDFAKHWTISGNYQISNNNSSIDQYDYKQKTFMLSLDHLF